MDKAQLIQSFKDQDYSLQRTLFTLKLQKIELSFETMALIQEIYGVSTAKLLQIKTGHPIQSGKQEGLHTLLMCRSCQKGDPMLVEQVSKLIDTPIGSTSSDGWISFDWMGCMGLCGVGPNAMLNQKIYPSINTNPFFIQRLTQLLEERKSR